MQSQQYETRMRLSLVFRLELVFDKLKSILNVYLPSTSSGSEFEVSSHILWLEFCLEYHNFKLFLP